MNSGPSKKGRLVVNGWFVVAIILAAILLWVVDSCRGQGDGRYLMIESTFLFKRTDELPFEILRPMCWNAEIGWCDAGMDERGHRLAYVVDFQTEEYAVVMQNRAGCWVWWFFPEYGEDGQPHVDENYWIACKDVS